VGQPPADRPVHDPAGQPCVVDAKSRHGVGGQIDPAAAEIFADVADEIGELKRHPQIGGVGLGQAPFAGGAEDGQHQQPDHRRRPPDVAVEVGVGRVAVDRDVRAHRAQKRPQMLGRQVESPRGVAHRRHHRLGRRQRVRRQHGGLQLVEAPGGVGQVAGGRVDDVVDVAGEAV